MLGPFAERLHVAEGFEVAIAAALGAAADAVAVDGLDAAAEILAALRRHDAGSARLVIAAAAAPAPARPDRRRLRRDPTPSPRPGTPRRSGPRYPRGPSRLARRPPRRSTWSGRPTSWRMRRRSCCPG